MATTQDFLSRVMPWPGSQSEPGYVNLHWLIPNQRDPTGKDIWVGRPTRDVAGFMGLLAWVQSKTTTRDIYYCLSLQAHTHRNKKGSVTAARHAASALALKAIWLDIDVKDPPKGYTSVSEALDALQAMCQHYTLPLPNALVGSGGGVHAYWIVDKPLTPAEWQPYAEGLKAAAMNYGLRCDAGVTSDCARVLRVPGTFNHKTTPPKPVQLLHLGATDYTTTDLAVLATMAPAVTVAVTGAMRWADGTVVENKGVKVESLAEGLRDEQPPLDLVPIALKCGFFREACATDGKYFNNPQWNLTTLASTFVENGREAAHGMAKGHHGYSPASTDALWGRKLIERTKGVGWPSCRAIEATGCKACATCPLKGTITSPLSLGRAKPASPFAAIQSGQITLADDIMDLPPSFVYNSEGIICKRLIERGKNGQPDEFVDLPLFMCKLSNPWAQKNPDALNFCTTTDKDNFHQATMLMENLMGQDTCKHLLRAKIKPCPPNKQYIEEFLMGFLAKLHNAQQASQTLPFGWFVENDKIEGFVFGGQVNLRNGTQRPAGFGDAKMRSVFQPTGSIDRWTAACRQVCAEKRPETQVITASAFAAPLMIFGGQYSGLISAWGVSGKGKSSALKTALAVWGHPKKGKEIFATTFRSVMNKMGELRNLPIYWDEIKDDKAREAVFNGYFAGAEGVDAGRLTSNIEQRDRGDWQTMMLCCSNESFGDYVARRHRTNAGLYRLLEYEVPPPDENGPGRIDTITAERTLQHLEQNYGVVGMQYAKLLAQNSDKIDALFRTTADDFKNILSPTQEERYWWVIVTATLTGAKLANKIGASFDIDLMKDFLVSVYLKNRSRLANESNEQNSTASADDMLTAFLKERLPETIWTDTFTVKTGKPSPVTLIWGMPKQQRRRGTEVQFCRTDRLLRISKKTFVGWCEENNASPSVILDRFRKDYGMTLMKARLGSGTTHSEGQESLMHLTIPVGSWLEEMLQQHMTPEETEALAKQQEAA